MASSYAFLDPNFELVSGLIQSVGFNSVSAASATDVDTANDKILKTGHPFIDTDLVLYTAGSGVIGGLTNGNYYYVVSRTANDYKLSLTLGGSAINLTGTGTGTQKFTQAAIIKVRVNGASSDVAESPLRTDVNGRIIAGSLAAVAVGTIVHFRGEEFRGMAFSVSQITT